MKEVEDKGRQLKQRLAEEFCVRSDEMSVKNSELHQRIRLLEEQKMNQDLHACDTR